MKHGELQDPVITGLIGRNHSTGRLVIRVGESSFETAGEVVPLAGIEVWLRSFASGDPPRRTLTDETGVFSFPEVPSGDYLVEWWVNDRGVIGPAVTVLVDP